MTIGASRVTLGERFSEGSRLLWKAMEDRACSQGELRRVLGAKAGVVPRWLYGDTRPTWNWAAKMRDVFGIPLEAWTLQPTRHFIPPAARELESGPLPDSSDSAA